MSALPIWPTGLTGYKTTAVFTETTIPAALLRDHATRDGVWARLHVLEGGLRFTDQEGGGASDLAPGVHELIFPGRLHNVAALGAVRFQVEFCRLSGDPAISAPSTDEGAFPHRKR